MTHKRKPARKYRWHICKVSIAVALTALLLTPSSIQVAHGFAADATVEITGLSKAHGSFHYEMTRVLAMQAGFTEEQAETIAVACEAVDAGDFTGYQITLENGTTKTVTVTIKNTERTSKNNLFYHFARRSAQYGQVTEVAGSTANTCDYFTGGNTNNPTTAPCTTKGPELDQIKNWAFRLDGVKPDLNQLPQDGSRKPIVPGSLAALAVYLHSVGDAYSHEKCMIDESLRSHPAEPLQCSATWHIDADGEFSAKNNGLPFTRAAAYEIWRGLRQFRHESETPTDKAKEFIETFITKPNACERVAYAVQAFNDLAGEKTTITCPPSRATPKQKKKRARRRG